MSITAKQWRVRRLATVLCSILPILAVLAVAFFALPVSADGSTHSVTEVVKLQPSADNTLYEDAAGTLSNGAGQYLFVGNTVHDGLRRGLIQFDVTGHIPAGAKILTATLTLNMSKSKADLEPITVHAANAAWGEGASIAGGEEGAGAPAASGDATWVYRKYDTERWSTPGGDFVPQPDAQTNVRGPGVYTWGSTAQMATRVQTWLDTPATNFGWLLIGNEATTQTTKRFDSRENQNADNRPVLTVTYAISRTPAIYLPLLFNQP